MKQITFVLLVTIITTAFTCQKEDKKDSASTPEGKLLTGTWERIAGVVKKEGKPDEDIFTVKLDCYKDNLYIYRADNTYVWDEGTTKCSAGDPQTDGLTKTWELRDGGKALWVTDDENQGGTVYKYVVEELTASKLILKEVYSDGSTTYTYAR